LDWRFPKELFLRKVYFLLGIIGGLIGVKKKAFPGLGKGERNFEVLIKMRLEEDK